MTNSKELFSEVVRCISLPEAKAEIESIALLLLKKKWNINHTDVLAEKKVAVAWTDVKPYLHRINTHEPIQYILGEADFFGRTFRVNPSVLIPRPETELLVHEIINHVKAAAKPLTMVDVGTGSGCIAISLALEVACTMHAVDVSLPALTVAEENARLLHAPVAFCKLDILTEPLPKKYDVLVSNPPYIAQSEKQSMKPNVLKYEPHTALFPPGNDPLLFYRVMAEQARNALHAEGSLWLEINEHYAKEVCEILEASSFTSVTTLKDWSGKERVVWGLQI